ncbi:MAG: ribose 5-phosphate isomerase B [Patescibacteria group bacterium]
MKIVIASDHSGFKVKEAVKAALKNSPVNVVDFGCFSDEPVDYPQFAQSAVEAVLKGEMDRAILICGTGIGMSIVANRYPGIRAALVYNEEVARLSREHNNANVLCLGAKQMSQEQIIRIIGIWLTTKFSREKRHFRRIMQINEMHLKRD